MWSLLLIAPGVLACYCLFLRKELSALPAFKTFYAEADGFWAKVWALCGKSVTMLWGYLLGGIGALLNNLDGIAAQLGDPNFNSQVEKLVHADPVWLGYFTMVVSAFTIAARLKGLATPKA